jgi:photosystem II stability/assembly factor-like uncharacterized protein
MAVVLSGLYQGPSLAAGDLTLAALAKQTHFHGIAVDARDTSRIYLATHHGLFVVGQDGKATLLSQSRDDFMGFTAHPSDPLVLYASGHPESGGNLGFIVSTDGGRTWTKLASGVGGPVDFHQMDVSKADAKVIYGVYGEVQRSADGGKTWSKIGPAPEGLIRLAASSKDANTLFAATQRGIFKSGDAGRTWRIAHIVSRPATMVYATRAGDVYAYMVGTGLLRAKDESPNWEIVSPGLGADVILHFAADPKDGKRLYAVTYNPQSGAQSVVTSGDVGASWVKLGSQ